MSVSPLRLVLAPATNTLWVDGREVHGRHRWEAALLALLAGGLHGPGQPLGDAQLQATLAARGQQVALNRKQLARLQESLQALLGAQGHELWARWRHAPRKRTVGPWWWQPQPGDEVEVHAAPADARVAQEEELPAMSREHALPAMLAMCRLVMTYQPRWEGGPYEAVLPVLADSAAWRGAAPALQAMRWLQTTSSHLHTRQLKLAYASLGRAERLLAQHPGAAAYLGTWAVTLRLGLLRIDPEDRRRRLGREMLARQLAGPPGHERPEADRLSRLYWFAFAAIGEVAALRMALRRHGRADAAAHVQQAVRLFNAALFCAFTGRHFDPMKSVLAHVGGLAHLLLEAGVVDDVAQPLGWFVLANQMRHKLGLVEDTHLISTGLGHCWLSVPAARRAFAELACREPWAGHRPDQLAFYQTTADETRALGDPRYHGRALINLLRYAREHRMPAEQRRVAAELQRLYAAQPGLADLFAAEGWPTG